MKGFIFTVLLKFCSPTKQLDVSPSRFFHVVAKERWTHPTPTDYIQLLLSCSSLQTLQQIHSKIISSGHDQSTFIATKLISQYTNFSESDSGYARLIFDHVAKRDVFLWNVMIRAYASSFPHEEAISLYDHMLWSGFYPNCHTFTFVLQACSICTGVIKKGKDVHCRAIKSGFVSDLFISNALIPFYAKCGEVGMAKRVFDAILVKDLVSWNSMIACYSRNENIQEALLLFHQMLKDDKAFEPDHFTFVSLLPVCAKLTAVKEGLWIHSKIVMSGIKVDVALGSGLVRMYCSCGRLPTAHLLFEKLPHRNVIVWNALISGYGMHGHAFKALEMFSEMLEADIQPDAICFASVLSACSHAGLVDEGWKFFNMMSQYDVGKCEVHYACMVDLLGRSGRLCEAMEFIRDMPVKAGKDVWGALLGACRIHNNVELAEEVAERLFPLDPDNAGRYSILANMYEDVGRWKDAARVRLMMREKGVKKPLGCSAVEVNSIMHTFGVEDESHPMTQQIYDALEGLRKMVEEDRAIAVG